MATVTSDAYWDDGTARAAGEAIVINNEAKVTIRADTRHHAGSPASMTGSLGNQTINRGELIYDGRNVRWLAFNNGSGNVPAIGTDITQAGVSTSYLLAVYSGLTVAPTAPGSSMPATGFLKFREVTGAFVAGALTGIGADATGADVAGWLEIVADQTSVITPLLETKHTIRGDWFYLDDTTGLIGQILQVPTNGGGVETHCPGAYIETSPGSGEYEYWPSLFGASNGWARQHLGAAEGETDRRQNFVKDIGSGQMQIGESSVLAATYASIAAQASTYANWAQSSTYTWEDDKVYVFYNSGHVLDDGQTVHLNFTTGDATPFDGVYTVTVIDAFNYSVDLAGSGDGGSVTATIGFSVTFTAHTLGVGDVVYCNFTSGLGVDGYYTIRMVGTVNTYYIEAPHAASTSGNVSVYSRIKVTFTAHGLYAGTRVYLDFTSGTAPDGIYTIILADANTFDVVCALPALTSGNVTVKQTIGNIPVAGCKIRIPNVFLRESTTAARASNIVAAALATRPEWMLGGGDIDFEYVYSTWYSVFIHANTINILHYLAFDYFYVAEVITNYDIEWVGISQYGALNITAFSFNYNYCPGVLSHVKAFRGDAGASSAMAAVISTNNNMTLSYLEGGWIQHEPTRSYAVYFVLCVDCTLDHIRTYNSVFMLSTSRRTKVTNLDHCDKFIGYTQGTANHYLATMATCWDCVMDGVTVGFGGLIPNVQPPGYLCYLTSSYNCSIRNVGTRANPINTGTWRPNKYATLYAVYCGGTKSQYCRISRIYCGNLRTGVLYNSINVDTNNVLEHICTGPYSMTAKTLLAANPSMPDMDVRGIRSGNSYNGASPLAFGTHFTDVMLGDAWGRLVLYTNKPTARTQSRFTMVSGLDKWSGYGMWLGLVQGNQCIWEDDTYRLGYTGFQNASLIMNGATLADYTVEYQLDTGSGFGGVWKIASGSNLASEVVDPAVGFKIKVRITCDVVDPVVMNFIIFELYTTPAAQLNLYPLLSAMTDTVRVTVKNALTGAAISGARVYLKASAGGPLPAGTEVVNELTDGSGVAETEVYHSETFQDQPVEGWVRKGPGSPFQDVRISGTIVREGLDQIVYLAPDEGEP